MAKYKITIIILACHLLLKCTSCGGGGGGAQVTAMKRSVPVHWPEEGPMPRADASAGAPAKRARFRRALKRIFDAGSPGSESNSPAPKVTRYNATSDSGGSPSTGGLQLSDSKIAELREIFALFDKDGDGEISPDELAITMRALGENLSPAEIEEMIAEVDTNGNGTVDFPEFVAITSDPTLTMSEEEGIREAFRVFDRGGKGFINATDVHHMMNVLGLQVTDEEVHEMMQEADLDRSGYGQISYEEFVALLTST